MFVSRQKVRFAFYVPRCLEKPGRGCGVGNNIPISEYPGTRNRSASSLSRFSAIQTLFTFSAEASLNPSINMTSVLAPFQRFFAEVGFAEVALDSRPCELCHCSR